MDTVESGFSKEAVNKKVQIVIEKIIDDKNFSFNSESSESSESSETSESSESSENSEQPENNGAFLEYLLAVNPVGDEWGTIFKEVIPIVDKVIQR